MRLFRIGDKVVSRDKLLDAVDAILDRSRVGRDPGRGGAPRRRTAVVRELPRDDRRGAPRTTRSARRIPRLERRGGPFARRELRARFRARDLPGRARVDRVGRRDQHLQPTARARSPHCGTSTPSCCAASDKRVGTIEKILGAEVVGISLGHSPIREDVEVDLAELERVLAAVMSLIGRSAREEPGGSARRSWMRRNSRGGGPNQRSRQCEHRLVEARPRGRGRAVRRGVPHQA